MKITKDSILATPCTFIPPAKYASRGYPSEPKTLEELLVGRLQRNPTYCKLVAKCRDEARRHDAKTESGKKTKKELPTWLLGEWSGAKKSQLIKFTPMLFFDIDSKDNDGLSPEEMKARVASLPFVAVAAISSRGQGIYGIVPIPDDASDENLLKGYFRALQVQFKRLGLAMDGQCKNINRARYLSIDPCPYIASECEVWDKRLKEPTPAPPRTLDYSHIGGNLENEYKRVVSMVEQCERGMVDPFSDKEDWRNLGRALAGVFGERGREPFLRWSKVWETTSGKRHNIPPDEEFTRLAQTTRFTSLGVVFSRCERVGIFSEIGRKPLLEKPVK